MSTIAKFQLPNGFELEMGAMIPGRKKPCILLTNGPVSLKLGSLDDDGASQLIQDAAFGEIKQNTPAMVRWLLRRA